MLAIRYLCALSLLLVTGCTSTKTSNTARTGTEQLLISNAVDQSLAKIDFSPMAGHKVLIEEKYLEGVDKGYIVSSVRHHVLNAGAQLAAKADDSDIILELRSGGVGTDNSDSYLGMPGITLPGMMSLPDVKLVTRSRQSAFAKLGLVAIDSKTQQVLGMGGVSLSMSDDNNWYVMGIGPYRQGSMEKEVKTSLGGLEPDPGSLPNKVAFKAPPVRRAALAAASPPKDDAGRIQLTAGEAPTITPAPSSAPAEAVKTPGVEKSPFE